ncbi:hypothetical protein [Lysinibacillus xylanilyticus]|uniref:hypothetical protein n=1 Tax=Lysinibacillus xylanilyticus TaxID=582475 RepID=UPI00382FFE15
MASSSADVGKRIDITNKTGKSFEEIRTNVQSITYEIGQISEASKVISQHANQVVGIESMLEQTNENTAIVQNISATTGNSMLLEEIAASAEALTEMLENLQQTVQQYKY